LDGSAPLLPTEERSWLMQELFHKHNAFANYRKVDGVDVIREVVTTPWNAVNPPDSTDPLTLQVDRYMALLALGLGLRGIPVLYINGFLGQPIKTDGLTDIRESNRENLNEAYIEQQMADPQSRMHQVYQRVTNLLVVRSRQAAMDPSGSTEVIVDAMNDHVAAVLLRSVDYRESILSLVNVSDHNQSITLDLKALGMDQSDLYDLVQNQHIQKQEKSSLLLTLKPYQVAWIKHSNKKQPRLLAGEHQPMSKSNSKTGGIDLTSANMNLQIQNSGGEIKFHINPAMLQQLKNAPGFVPVIIEIQPINNMHMFLEIKEPA
jgi:hypothetical protein